MDWKDRPPYARPPVTGADPLAPRYRARCLCGAVELVVGADPLDARICHCRRCQRLHGAPFQWAVLFRKTDVRFVAGLDALRFFDGRSVRAEPVLPCTLSCDRCRTPIADEGRRVFLAFGPLFDFGEPPVVPPAFEPRCHLFYGSRVLDVDDGKPKYAGPAPRRAGR